jgi:PAS domain S-box-containing protein
MIDMTEDTGGVAQKKRLNQQAAIPQSILFLAKQRSWPSRVLWLVMPIAIATLLTQLRFMLISGSAGVPVVFYLPAIIVTTVTSGLEFGLVALAVSGALVWYIFIPPAWSFQTPTQPQTITLVLWILVSGCLVWFAYFLRISLQQLAQNELRYRKLVSVTSDVIWVTDGDGNANQPNPAWTEITGVPWPDFRGLKWADSVHEEDRPLLVPDGKLRDDFHQAEFRLWNENAGGWRWHRSNAVGITAPDGRILQWMTAIRDVHDSRREREHNEVKLGEARHRLKNLIAIIEALAKSSRPTADGTTAEIEIFLQRFLGRLRALGAAADLTLANEARLVELGAVVRATLEPFTHEDGRIIISGPEIALSSETAGGIGLAVHELATNATKYGALSVPGGSVSLHWDCAAVEDRQHVEIVWTELGGPPVEPPLREGYGSRVIRAAAAPERENRVEFEYQPSGFVCRISFAREPSA